MGLLELSATESTITYSIRETADAGTFRPTHLMERISRYLEDQDEPVSRNAVEANVPGKAEAKRLAVKLLIEEGYAVAAEGPRGSQPVTSVRPYREAEDRYIEEQTTASPTASHCVLLESRVSQFDCVPASHPLGGTRTRSKSLRPSEAGRSQDEVVSVNAGFDVEPEDAGPPEFDPYGDELDRMRIKKDGGDQPTVLTPEQDAAIDAFFAARDGEA